MKNSDVPKILFHYLPPAYIYQPLSAFAVLKNFLADNDYLAQVKYWNAVFYSDANAKRNSDHYHLLDGYLPFLYFFSDKYKDDFSSQKILLSAFYKNPEMIIRDSGYYKDVLMKQLYEASLFVKNSLGSINSATVLLHGFTAKFDQWIPAAFFAEEIKKIHPNVPIVIGGFQTKEHALVIMQKIKVFDFAIWGEGEYPLLELCRTLESKSGELNKVPRLIFRKDKIYVSEISNTPMLDINRIHSDHEDYVREIGKNNINADNIFLTIEDSRGCRWNKCRFCSLYNGYKYVEKDNKEIISEIKRLSSLHDMNNFIFTGANLAANINKLNSLLDMLIELKDQTNQEYNFVAEITPKNIPEATIKKMAEASFIVQIGYESTSDNILAKMRKPSRFIDLLFFVKNAIKYGLRIEGANILSKIPNEQEEDVLEAVYNLSFLRFFLGQNNFSHEKYAVHVDSSVPFMKDISVAEKEYWNKNRIASLLPCSFFDDIDRFEIFSYESSVEKNSYLWNKFWTVNDYYSKNDYYYRLHWREDGRLSYNEFNKGALVKSLFFDELEYIDIFKLSNDIISFGSLLSILTKKYKKLTARKLLCSLKILEQECLIVFDKKTCNVLSVIDV